MVMGDEFSQSPTQVPFAERDESIQALLFHRSAGRRDPGLRSRSEVEQDGRAAALHDGRSRHPNTAVCAELQCACRTICPRSAAVSGGELSQAVAPPSEAKSLALDSLNGFTVIICSTESLVPIHAPASDSAAIPRKRRRFCCCCANMLLCLGRGTARAFRELECELRARTMWGHNVPAHLLYRN